MYIIDFDDTIFDTAAFKQKRKQAVAEHGVPAELFDDTLRSISARGGYTNEIHAREIAEHGFDYQKLLEALETTTHPDRLKELVLPDTEHFLTTLRTTGAPLVLLTWCNPSFQQGKIEGAGIIPYFDDLILTPDSKLVELRNLL